MPRQPTPSGLSVKTVAELRAIAKSRGNVRNYSRLRKAELVRALKDGGTVAGGAKKAVTVAQLRGEARRRKVPGYSRMTKASLLRALESKNKKTVSFASEPSYYVPCLMTERDVRRIGQFFKTHPEVGRFQANNPCRTLQSLFPPSSPCVKGWAFEAILGVGRYGLTVGIRSTDVHQRQAAFKVVTTRSGLDDEDAQEATPQDPVQEARVQEAFAKAGIAPKILQVCTKYSPKIAGRKKQDCPEYAMIVMERIAGVANTVMHNLAAARDYPRMLDVTQDLWRQCTEILAEMARLGYTHGDMNLGNIAVNADEDRDFGTSGMQVLLIDYGLATTKFACTASDIAWFTRNMCSPFHIHVAETEYGDWNADYQRLYREFLLPSCIALFEWGISATQAELARPDSKLPKALGRKGVAAMRRLITLYGKYPWSTADAKVIAKTQKEIEHAYMSQM